MVKLTRCLIIFLTFLFTSCKKENDSNFIDKETTIDCDSITELNLNRGILTMKNLNNKYIVYSWCNLIYKDSFPKWIKDKGKPDYTSNKYQFKPCISDIEIPYLIFKRKNENFFSLVKNKDTLIFKIAKD